MGPENMGMDPSVMATIAAAQLEFFKPLVEQAAGYKQHAIELGFNDAAATQMSIDFHSYVLRMFGSSTGR